MQKMDFYGVLGLAKTASRTEIKEAYRRLAVEYHPDRNKSPEAEERFKEISQAYSVLSNPEQRSLYNALGPEKYDDPREVFRFYVEREVDRREMKREEREYEAVRSAQQYSDAGGLGFMIFILLIVDFVIPSWVFGPWFYVFNAFLILAIAIGIHDQVKG